MAGRHFVITVSKGLVLCVNLIQWLINNLTVYGALVGREVVLEDKVEVGFKIGGVAVGFNV